MDASHDGADQAHARLFTPLSFARGPAMANRIALAPMTTDQALPDGTLPPDELRWIARRAQGGFGLVMTSASYVQPNGKAGGGQTGLWSDAHIPSLAQLAQAIRVQGRVATLQLHHAGCRAWKRTVSDIVAPSPHAETGARALSTAEVEQVAADFVAAAVRAEHAGFDGVELHGAHGYLLAQFLSVEDNRRDDRYGGSLENRARLITEIIAGVRHACRPDFQLGLRLSPERWGMRLGEMRELAARFMQDGDLDWLDLSLWDAAKQPEDASFASRPLLGWFTDLPRGGTRLGVAGRITTPRAASAMLAAGAEFVMVGRTAILHPDWPRLARDPAFTPLPTPVGADYLAAQDCGARFIRYLHTFQNFVASEQVAS
ncbi:NADH:flavin oxidoreductase [Zavarzinia sp. CC-PAN008]|uniref:NADH:flavin oxidoreductase n=1 Tax=Zavarzinia sp. CC-PAN008 TaxID=3243332 RepID=UPI003F748304